jgi:hypothetical protein
MYQVSRYVKSVLRMAVWDAPRGISMGCHTYQHVVSQILVLSVPCVSKFMFGAPGDSVVSPVSVIWSLNLNPPPPPNHRPPSNPSILSFHSTKLLIHVRVKRSLTKRPTCSIPLNDLFSCNMPQEK